jgi:hypothetical protein
LIPAYQVIYTISHFFVMSLRRTDIFNLTHTALMLFTVILILIACSSETITRAENNREIKYRINTDLLHEYEGFLKIPGVGFQEFFDLGFPRTNYKFHHGSFYIRQRWSDFEPQEGVYAFGLVDGWLEECRKRGMALCLRFGDVAGAGWGDPHSVPKWLRDRPDVKVYDYDYRGTTYYTVDIGEPAVWQRLERLVRAFAERYDGHPDLALIEIGHVGLWGEWHNYVARHLLPSQEVCNAVIDLYHEVWKETPLTINDDANYYVLDEAKWTVTSFFPRIAQYGRCGWRGDGFGSGAGEEYDFHKKAYWPLHNAYPDLWRNGPVGLEPLVTFGDTGTSPKEAIDDAIAWHTTHIHNKWAVIPDAWLPEIERLMKVVGFRLVLRNLYFTRLVAPEGFGLAINMDWENTGIAPPYRDHRIALRLRDINDKVHAVTITGESIKGWLPGKKNISVKYEFPNDLPEGDYSLEMGLVFHSSIGHDIPIANQGRTREGWYVLGDVNL